MNYQGHYQVHTSVGRIFLLILLSTIMLACTTNAQRYQKPTSSSEDQTLSPYLQIINDDEGNAVIPLKHTEADVTVTGVIADVKVTQVYQNEGGTPIEAIYVFPGSTRAAVHGMTMQIGERIVSAEIKKKDDARKAYEEAKQNGQSASLLEQHRPNVFQMNVANIMPGDSLVVNLEYTELLVPTEGIYEFVYPTVVGPRYNDDPGMAIASTDNSWAENPYQREGELPLYTFNINAVINAGIPIKKAKCISHDMKVSFNGPSTAELKLDPKELHGGNRDVIIRYGLRGGKVESGLLLFEGEKENFFLAMMEPPKRVEPEMIPPREYVFVVDVSGSMNGFPLDVSKSLMRELFAGLRPSDSFNVLLFASGNSVLSDRSLPANPANIQKAINLIDKQRGGGGTQLLPALKRALNLPHEGGIARSIVIATDGYITIEKEAFDLVRDNLGEANFFAFGIGSSVNRHLIEGLASIGKGEPFVLTSAKEAKANASKFREYIQSPVLTDISVKAEGIEIFDVEPYSVPDVLAERPVIVFGKFKKGNYGKLKITGTSGLGLYEKEFEASNVLASTDNEALKFLWARKRIELLDDYAQLGHTNDIKEEVTDLGLKYGLLTAYTSFVAVDKEVRNADGKLISISQPLPVPQGVSDMAVGNANTQSFSMSKAAPMRHRTKRAEYAAEEAEAPSFDLPDEDLSPIFDQRTKGDSRTRSAKVYSSSSVDAQPVFAKGEKALAVLIRKHLKSATDLGVTGVTGKVYVEFVVNESGMITNMKIKRGVHPKLDEEAKRVVALLSGWTPGTKAGKAVKTRMVLPIEFK